MFKDFISKLFNLRSNRPPVPKSFKKTNRTIFLNKYAGLVYFLVAWHTFGYLIAKLAKLKANKEGIELHEALAQGAKVTKIELDKDFKFKVTDLNQDNIKQD